MNLIIKDLQDLNESLYNIRINIGSKTNYEQSINKHIVNDVFEKYENCFKKFCQFQLNKKYMSYHHNNLVLNIINDVNYTIETNILKNYFLDVNQKYININLIKNNIQDNIVFPNLEHYQNIIKHNDNIYKFVIKNINVPIYIHFDKNNYNNIYLETELNIQQLNYGFDSIQYLLKFFK
jgi:hypothetical protein